VFTSNLISQTTWLKVKFKLVNLTQTYESFVFLSETKDILSSGQLVAGSVQQAASPAIDPSG